MNKNSSIFSFNISGKKFFLTVVICFLLFYWFSLIAYLLFPRPFYWRAWEYFDEILYSRYYSRPQTWKGYEKGHLSRIFCNYQEKWETCVTADEDGFRVTPLKSKSYPIVVGGDSHTWGSGLNDEETIPWQLAEKLQLPVYNASRSSFEKVLAKTSLKNAKVLIEIFSYHNLNLDVFPTEFRLEDYAPLKRKNTRDSKWVVLIKRVLKVFTQDPRRYFLPFKLNRYLSLETFYNTFYLRKKYNDAAVGKEGYLFQLSDEMNQQLADRIEKRSDDLKKRGYHYVFVALPPKELVCSDIFLGTTRANIDALFCALRARKIDAIDLSIPFCNAPRRKSLYFHTDLHINSDGAKLAAQIIADRLLEGDATDVWDNTH